MSGHSPTWSDHCGWYHWPPVMFGLRGVPRPAPTLAFEQPERCSDCGGESVQFRGAGTAMQYRICPRIDEIGHLTREAVAGRIAAVVRMARPSGRFG